MTTAAIVTLMPIHASASDLIPVYVVASFGDSYFFAVSSIGAPYYFQTESTPACAPMSTLVHQTVNLDITSGAALQIPNRSDTCALVDALSPVNEFRREPGFGLPMHAYYVVSATDAAAVVANASGDAWTITATDCGSLKTLATRLVYLDGGTTPEPSRDLFIFSRSTACAIKSVSFFNSTSLPSSAFSAETEYEDGTWTVSPGGHRIPPVFATAPPTSPPTVPSPGQTGTNFSDVPQTHFAYPYVQQLANDGVIQRTSLFRPDDAITRAEFVKLVVLTRKRTPAQAPFFTPFNDVAASHSLAPYIATAAAAGWVGGSNGTFRPDDPITRLEAVTVLFRAYALSSTQPSTFRDISSTDSFTVGALQSRGVVSGVNGRFEPDRPITRAEAAKIVSAATAIQ